MQIFRHVTANGVYLERFPFMRELSMEAYLVENERVLTLNDTFKDVEIRETELTLKQGRSSQDTDGRIDILATYAEEYIAVVELKIGELVESHLTQLEDYLKTKDQILTQYPNILNKSVSPKPKWIGVLVGSSIESNLGAKLENGYLTESEIPIAALTIERFRGKDGSIYVATDTYFNDKSSTRDTQKYKFEGVEYGKGRLVLEVVKRHVESHPDITYDVLEHAFPRTCQGAYGVFSTVDKANEIYAVSGRKRNFLNPDELIQLYGSRIAICSQWGIGNIDNFIRRAKELGYRMDSQ